MQGTWVWSLVPEDATEPLGPGATPEPMCSARREAATNEMPADNEEKPPLAAAGEGPHTSVKT